MLGNIFHDRGGPAERPLHLVNERGRISPQSIIRRNIRRDPAITPGDEIYDRARIIFSRARSGGSSRTSTIV